jgi:hypothetical protein
VSPDKHLASSVCLLYLNVQPCGHPLDHRWRFREHTRACTDTWVLFLSQYGWRAPLHSGALQLAARPQPPILLVTGWWRSDDGPRGLPGDGHVNVRRSEIERRWQRPLQLCVTRRLRTDDQVVRSYVWTNKQNFRRSVLLITRQAYDTFHKDLCSVSLRNLITPLLASKSASSCTC